MMSGFETQSMLIQNSKKVEDLSISKTEKDLLVCFLTLSEILDLFTDPNINLARDVNDEFIQDVLLVDLSHIIRILRNYPERIDVIDAEASVYKALEKLYKIYEASQIHPRGHQRIDVLLDFRNRLQDAFLRLESMNEIKQLLSSNNRILGEYPTKSRRNKHADSKSLSENEPPGDEPPEIGSGNSSKDNIFSDEVWFTAFHPEKGKIDTWFPLLVYAHVLSAIEKVRQDANRFKDQLHLPKIISSPSSSQITRGTDLTIIPNCKGITFNPSRITVKWMEDYHRADFRFRADKSLIDDAAKGQITIYAGTLIIGVIKFAMLFRKNKEETPFVDDHEECAKMYGKDDVFISYSRKDTEVARTFKTILSATGMDVFLDVDNLRSGQLWKNELLNRIEHAKIFQMFWSENYSQSKNCRMEWKHALKQKKGEGYIRPVYWKVPLSPNPPDELSKFNFQYVKLPYNKDKP